MFDDDQSSISRMYRQLRIQHHLIQDENLSERPDIPGLTTYGFERWLSMMILAHPEEEFERIKLAALNMPINNPDDKKERFPKELPKRLFPKTANHEIRELLVGGMETHARITIERQNLDVPTPKAEQTPQQRPRKGSEVSHQSFTDASVTSEPAPPVPPPGNIERERKPYSKVPAEAIIDDTNPTPTPTTARPIERERKPYSVAPGGGRVYEDPGTAGASIPNGSAHQPPPPSGPPPSGPAPGLHRSSSTTTRPVNIPPPPAGGPAPHRLSTSEFAQPQIHQAHLGHRASIRRARGHSPSVSAGVGNEFRRSDNDLGSFQTGSYEPPSNFAHRMSMRDGPPPAYHPPPEPAHEEDLRRYSSREAEVRRGDYIRGGSPNRKYEPERRGTTYSEEDFYRVPSRREPPIYR